jgi:hypothetical protein
MKGIAAPVGKELPRAPSQLHQVADRFKLRTIVVLASRQVQDQRMFTRYDRTPRRHH